MNITVNEFIENTSGVSEYEIWGKEMEDGSCDYGIFFYDYLHENPTMCAYEIFKNRKIESFKFKCERDGWVECALYLKD